MMDRQPFFTEPVPNFNDALAVIRAYHVRMLELCRDLTALGEQVELNKVESGFDEAARLVYHYFTTATGLHHRDEEQTLFPRLTRTSSRLMNPMIERLEEDHVEIEGVWDQLAPLLRQPGSIEDKAFFVKAAYRFAQLLRWHIEREEDNFLPEAEKFLSMEQRQLIGAEMARNRRLAPKIVARPVGP